MCMYIVDDEELACRGLAYMVNCIFSSIPQEIHCFTSPVEALSKMETFPPDIILLDMVMEEMNGLEFINHIDKKHSPKIVIISGNDTYSFIRESFKLSVEDYLLKPIEFNELEAVMLKLQKNSLESSLSVAGEAQEVWSFVAIVKSPCVTELSNKIISIPKLCDPKASVSALTYSESYGESVFIFSLLDNKYYDECKSLFGEIFSSFAAESDILLKAACSDCVKQTEVNKAISQAKALLKYRLYDDNSRYYDSNNEPDLDETSDDDFRAELIRMTPFLSSEDKDSYKRFINIWFSPSAL